MYASGRRAGKSLKLLGPGKVQREERKISFRDVFTTSCLPRAAGSGTSNSPLLRQVSGWKTELKSKDFLCLALVLR